MNVAASKSPDLNTEHGLAGIPSCSDWLGGQILSLSWELWLQGSQGCSLDLYSSWLAAQLYIPNPALYPEMWKPKPSSSESLLCSQFAHCSQGLLEEGWRTASRWCVYSSWKFLHSSQLGGEWENAHPPVNNHTEKVAKLLPLSKMEMPAGATAWAQAVGMWAATLHACPGSCASSPPPWPHTAPAAPALSPAPSNSFVLSTGERLVLMAG